MLHNNFFILLLISFVVIFCQLIILPWSHLCTSRAPQKRQLSQKVWYISCILVGLAQPITIVSPTNRPRNKTPAAYISHDKESYLRKKKKKSIHNMLYRANI
uniref:Uncharacterized protein n=1 Tax=Ixodes ricinus TaxID=34613 RepID=A0A6B0UFA2_IXORI